LTLEIGEHDTECSNSRNWV